MLKKLKLTMFRQHQDREFEFGPGLNAVKGANESGKSTSLEAFTYFCFGSGALRESLDDVVTYHQPVTKLRVDCQLEHLGVTYSGYRGKSGAEVTFGNERVTGQREVTKFFERLFGTTADMAGKLMFASQKSLAESLKAGPTAAGQMIEDLANFDLIDRVAEAIASQRQTGNTSSVEGRITALRVQLVDSPIEDLTALRAQILGAQKGVTEREKSLADLRALRAQIDVEKHMKVEQDDIALRRQIDAANSDIATLDRALATAAVVGPTEAEVDAARAAVEGEKQYAKAATLHADLLRADTAELWDNDLASLEAESLAVEARIAELGALRSNVAVVLLDLKEQLANAQRDADVTIAQLQGRLIREGTCALCQKDLADVPEVVRANSDLQRQIDAVDVAIGDLGKQLDEKIRLQQDAYNDLHTQMDEQLEYLNQLTEVGKANAKVEQLYARVADYIEVDRARVPGAWRWVGPAIAADRPDVAGHLRALEAQQRAALVDASQRQAKTEQRDVLVRRRDADTKKRQALPLAEALAALTDAADLDQQVRDVVAPLWGQQQALAALQADLGTRVALAEQQARQVAQVRTQLAQAEAELATMQKYNLLIKKVRQARPVITNKLWNIVLAGVSKHFTDVRGVPSVVTRGDGKFLCNGFPVSGLSGSAEDMLGLSMRIALTRTFLPGADFLQLDEPAAACSDAREQRMLGVLSTLGFGQTIIVSHSDLTDAVADRIINV